MRLCEETITLFPCRGGAFSGAVTIPGCSWHGPSQEDMADGGSFASQPSVVRIPESSLGDTLPQPGDYLLRGIPSEAMETAASLAAQGLPWGKVISVTDNRHRRLPHIKVTVE